MPPTGESPDVIPRGLIIAFIIVVIAIIASGIYIYQSQEHQIKDKVTSDLTLISTLKADQISAWREDRLFDARVISAGAFFKNGADHYLTNGDDESRENILIRFREMNESLHYDNVMLVDPQGNVRLSLDPTITSIQPSVKARVNESIKSGTVTLTDFQKMPHSDREYLNVIAPLLLMTNASEKPVGAVLLSIDPADFLYPLVQSWPVASGSAETLLVQREGDQVLFLNELRHQNNTALNLTIPLSQTDVPAVMAVLGMTGAFSGKDYRGIDVISVLEPVPGSPWFMVAKVDTEEAYSSWRSRSVLIIVMVAGTLVGAFIIIGLFWQRRQKSYYRSLYTAEAERREEEQQNRERLETLLRLSEMGSASEQELMDFVLDAGCRLTNSSLAFIGVMSPEESVFDITAWSKSAMKDCSVAASPIHFPIDKAGIWAEAVRKRKPLIVNDYTVPRTGKKGLPPGHVPITRFVSVPIFDGQRIVMVCAVANKETDYATTDVDNLTLLMQGVWNHLRKRSLDEALRQRTSDLEAAYEEITASEEELKANYDQLAYSQRALAESERKYRNLYQFAQVGLFETSFKDATIVACNQRYADLAGFKSVEDAIGKDILHLYVNPEDRADVGRVLREKGFIENQTLELRNQSTGKIFWAQFSARYNFEREVAEGSIIDITAQKDAEARLKESNEYLTSLFDYANAPIIVWDHELKITRFNHAFEQLTGCMSDMVIGKPVGILFPEDTREHSMEFIRQAMRGERWETVEIPILRRDGTQRLVLWNSANVNNPDGTAFVTIAQGVDITERKVAVETLRETNEYLKNLIDYANAPIIVWDPMFRITRFNHAFERLTGRTEQAVLGQHIEILFPESSRDASLKLIRQTLTGERWEVVEIPIIHLSGEIRIVLWNSANIVDPKGTIISTIAQGQDITFRKQAEEGLKASEEKFSTAFKTSPYAITITRIKDGHFIEVNDAFTPITGFTHEEALSGSSVGFGLWVDAENRKRVLSTLLDGRTVNGEVFLFKRKNGELITGLFSARIISINNEPCILSSINDISDRMRAEEDLRKSELRFRTMTDWTYDWEYWINPERDALYVSPSVERITGYSPDEFVVDKGLMERLILPDDYALWEKHVLLHADADQHGNHAQIEFRIIRKDGTVRWIGHVCRSIYTEDGTWAGTRVSNRDITDRKAVEDALRQSEEKYRVLFTRMIEGSALHEMVYDPSGNPVDYRIIDVNPAFESSLGIRRDDVIGKTSREAYGVDAPPYFDIYARVATTGQPEWFEVYFAPMKKHFAISAYSTRKGRFATIFEDITDRKEAEELREHLIQELEQKNAELERFTYTVSHDLKSPLITIKGFAGLIEDDAQKGDPVQLKKDINRITSAADTMQELLADVLELSRIGRVVSPPEKTSFSTIAHEAVELLAGPLAKRGVTVSIAPDLPLVNVDHARIREVVVNLIENAVKFLGTQEEPVIRIGVEMQGTTPVFFVQDNGIGIDPRYLERIFNLFERLDVSTHGTGIGLTIVRRIIEVHGGKIWAESEGAGKGTTFKFTLPGVPEGEVRP
jgi:PAS domain S-box-containing protein